MKLYNSKTNSIEVFKSIKENEVSMYVCGPTVYNHPHIGNARPIVVFDVLRRTLEATGYNVKMVSNFTDVDDRIIQKALDEGVDETVITKRYIDAYNEVRQNLNAIMPEETPYATHVIADIIGYIETMIDLGFAYESNGDVYFRVTKVKDYGEISSQRIEDLMVGARIEENTNKENPLDFALWKKTDDHGIKWDSPWGKGRPGWHTECVVMIHDSFTQELIDIHGGGQDLRFPHHENESAQSKAVHDHDIANYWVHNAMVNLDGVKMSKSLGNVVWAKDYLEKFGSNVTRWILMSANYRLILNISDDVISQSQTEVNRIELAYRQASIKLQRLEAKEVQVVDQNSWDIFLNAMHDDMNVANAQAELFNVVKKMNQLLRVRDVDVEALGIQLFTLNKMLWVLGIVFEPIKLEMADFELFNQWDLAKVEKDFERADVLRQELVQKGLI